MIDFGTAAMALYAGHHLGDYWIQTDHQARHKGDRGRAGRLACLGHVTSYTLTQLFTLLLTAAVLGRELSGPRLAIALAISAATHYAADRRTHGPMFWLAALLPGKRNFLSLGQPRPHEIFARPTGKAGGGLLPLDNPSLGTGAWALDQAWHIVLSVYVPALVLVG